MPISNVISFDVKRLHVENVFTREDIGVSSAGLFLRGVVDSWHVSRPRFERATAWNDGSFNLALFACSPPAYGDKRNHPSRGGETDVPSRARPGKFNYAFCSRELRFIDRYQCLPFVSFEHVLFFQHRRD